MTAASGEIVGILFDTVDVTYGSQPGALLMDGAVNVERLPDTEAGNAVQELIAKMPYIKFFVDGKLQVAGAKGNGSLNVATRHRGVWPEWLQ